MSRVSRQMAKNSPMANGNEPKEKNENENKPNETQQQ